jgi:hypothetical protein
VITNPKYKTVFVCAIILCILELYVDSFIPIPRPEAQVTCRGWYVDRVVRHPAAEDCVSWASWYQKKLGTFSELGGLVGRREEEVGGENDAKALLRSLQS